MADNQDVELKGHDALPIAHPRQAVWHIRLCICWVRVNVFYFDTSHTQLGRLRACSVHIVICFSWHLKFYSMQAIDRARQDKTRRLHHSSQPG